MKDEIDDIREIMTKYLAGEATPAEVRTLSTWRQQSRENESEFQETKNVFDAATRHYERSVVPDVDVNKEWAIFLDKVDDKPVRQLTPWSRMMRIAASVLVLIAAGAILYFFANRREMLVMQTASAIRKLELPDGSTVTLNRNSSLEYGNDFGKDHRLVTLKGEAFFEVIKDPSIPFVILARGTTIEVVGTSFNVLAYDSISEVEVIVKTGVVRFSVPELDQTVELTAGEKGGYANETKTLSERINENINFEAWSTRKLTFNETHLTEVIEAVNKTYNTNIVLSGPVSDSCLLTASFDNQSLEAVLNVLENTLNITFRRSGNQIEIIAAGC